MDCSENENVCSVRKENNLGFYRLHTIWKNDGFFINITSRDGAWRGEMTPTDVLKMSAQLEMEPETYLSQCKEALTSHDGQPGMVYAVENGSFSWKKIVDEDSGMKVRMGSVMVETTSFVDTIQNLVHAALNCNKKLQKELLELTQEKKKILESKNELLSKLNELVETKNTMENDLYARFLLLLNSKKKKIEMLENALEEEYKKSKGISCKFGKSGNPYEVDTDNDDSDLEERIPKLSIRGKRKPESGQKSLKKKSDLPEEAHGKKKSRKVDKFSRDKEQTQLTKSTKSISPEPGTSKSVQKIKRKEIPSTKDELLDYFYGNV